MPNKPETLPAWIIPKIEVKPLEWAKPAKWNPRLITDKQFDRLRKSIQKDPQFMTLRPILATKKGTIYAGSMRSRALKELGYKDGPFIVTDISEEEAKARSLRDNNHFGEYQLEELAQLAEDIKLEKLDMELLGLPENLIRSLTGPEEEAVVQDNPPATPDKPKSKLGSLYELGEHRLLCGDSTKQEDVDKLMAGAKVDLVFTDPPYGVAYVGKTKDALTIQNDEMDDAGTRKLVADAMKVIPMKSGACFYICSPAGNTETAFRLAIADAGLMLKQCIVWVKDHFVMGRQDYHWRHESLLYGWREGAAHFYGGGRAQDTVWECKRPTVSKEHPTMKPIELCAKAIANNTKGEDIVYDGFGGSGSTMIACEQLKRRCYTMEIDPRYVDVIVKRWENLTKKKAKLL